MSENLLQTQSNYDQVDVEKPEVCNLDEREEKEYKYKAKLQSLLEGKKDQKKEISKCKDLHEGHVYCKANKLLPQQYGSLIEKFVIDKCHMQKNPAKDCIGDCKDKYGQDNEVKVALGGKDNNQFNYVQLRPNHKVHNYIFTAYYLCKGNIDQLGELFIFKIKKEDINKLISTFGGYAHGTKSTNGPITLEDINDENNRKEYDLRPKYGSELWKELLKFRVTESDL